MASRRKEKQKRQLAKRQAKGRQAEQVAQQPRIMCTACREAGREASTLFYIIECAGDCTPGGCGGDHLLAACAACGAPSAVIPEDFIATMADPATCSRCGKVFDFAHGAGVCSSIGAPPGVDEIYYCQACAS